MCGLLPLLKLSGWEQALGKLPQYRKQISFILHFIVAAYLGGYGILLTVRFHLCFARFANAAGIHNVANQDLIANRKLRNFATDFSDNAHKFMTRYHRKLSCRTIDSMKIGVADAAV
jgi:hypothetical protein